MGVGGRKKQACPNEFAAAEHESVVKRTSSHGGEGGGGWLSVVMILMLLQIIQFNSKNFNYPTRCLIILTFV